MNMSKLIEALFMAFLIAFLVGQPVAGQGTWEDNVANPATWTSGNVGIGTATPGRLLDVRGGVARFGNGISDFGQFDAAGNLMFGGGARYFVAANTHAFKAAGNNIGLYFNADDERLEFQDAAGLRMFSTDIDGLSAGNGYFDNDLTVNNDLFISGDLIVGPDTYAFKAQASDIGLYLNQVGQRIEITNNLGQRMFSVNVSGTDVGDGYLENDLQVGGTISAAAFAGDGSQLTNIPGGSGLWTENGSDIYYDAGRVGIGLLVPGAMLDVFHDGSGADVLRLWEGNILRARMDDAGNVGIGTEFDALTHKFTVKDNNHQIALIDNDNGDKRWTLTSVQNQSGFGVYEDGADGRLVVAAGGAVGIGTTDPGYQLHVQRNSNSMGSDRVSADISELNTVFQRFDNSLAQAVGVGFSHSTNADNVGAAILHERVGGESLGKLHFATKQSSDAAVNIPIAMTIDNVGEVGIGTVNPTDDLHIVDGSFARIQMQATDPAADVSVFIDARGDGTDGGQLGTLSDHNLVFYTNSVSRMWLTEAGDVGIGTSTPQSRLAVQGKITAQEVEVTLSGWPDFVFQDDYDLMPLSKVESHIEQYGHLPGVPSQTEVLEDGVALGEMQALLLQKIEELTLHMIDLNNQVADLKRENVRLKSSSEIGGPSK